MTDLAFRVLRPGAHPPARSRPGDAAFDLRVDESFVLDPQERRQATTGIAVAIPEGMAGLVLSRSGLTAKHGIIMLNAPGLIDPNYRGEVGLIMFNAGTAPYEVQAGDRVAQLLVVPFASVVAVQVDELPPAADDLRGEQGFGSSGR